MIDPVRGRVRPNPGASRGWTEHLFAPRGHFGGGGRGLGIESNQFVTKLTLTYRRLFQRAIEFAPTLFKVVESA